MFALPEVKTVYDALAHVVLPMLVYWGPIVAYAWYASVHIDTESRWWTTTAVLVIGLVIWMFATDFGSVNVLIKITTITLDAVTLVLAYVLAPFQDSPQHHAPRR